jgi:hypothetical protein
MAEREDGHPELRETASGPAPKKVERQASDRRIARRRVLQAGLALSPVVLTVKSRPAWAQSCAPGMVSADSLSLSSNQSCVPEVDEQQTT